MKILNLGCSSKTSNSIDVINIDWSLKLLLKKNFLLKILSNFILSNERKIKIKNLPNNIMVYDLSRGIPFEDNSVDVVYHSHLLEHIDRYKVPNFLNEVKRVLKPNGIHRIVVPDFYLLCSNYMKNFELSLNDEKYQKLGDDFIANILEQSVRKEAYGTSIQGPIIRIIENILLGDARKRGETHQWMYDKFNLSSILKEVGFKKIEEKSFNSSEIDNWEKYKLDIDDDQNEYKFGSLYIESRK